MNKFLKRLFLKIPFLKIVVRNYLIKYSSSCEPGHYHSPIPNILEIEKNAESIFRDKTLLDIDLNTENQIKLLEELKIYYPGYPYNSQNHDQQYFRYKKEGAYYRFSDSVFLYCMMRKFKPKRIIEIGSGHSSAIMLDISEQYFDNKIHHTFIEPFPEDRLMKILRESDSIANNIIKDKVQSVKLELFQLLDKNDILFIDSSHVSKIDSDVNYLLFEVIPALKPGVLIHFHDIFYPFELPRQWILERRWFWNENYLLHAFLMNNRKFDIVIFNSYLHKIRPDWFKKEMPECLIECEDTGSIWIRKLV